MPPIKSYVYISYSHKDRDFALKLVEDLNDKGIITWLDIQEIKPGERWMEVLSDGIKNASMFLVIVSKNYIESSWGNIEILSANDKNKKIIPIKIDNTNFNELKSILNRNQGIDFNENYKTGLNKLLNSIPESLIQNNPITHKTIKNKGYVFISYSEKDYQFIIELKRFLVSQKFAYWDYKDGDRDYHIQFSLELESIIMESVATLSVLSANWKYSNWPVKEYLFSEEIKKPVLLLKVKPMPPTLVIAGLPYIDFVLDKELGFERLSRELIRKGL